MNKKPATSKDAADKLVKSIRRKTCSAEEKIRIVFEWLKMLFAPEPHHDIFFIDLTTLLDKKSFQISILRRSRPT